MALIFEPVDGHWLVIIGFLALVIIPSNVIVITTWNITGKRKHISTLLSFVAVSDSCLLLVDVLHKSFQFIEVEGKCKFYLISASFGTLFHSFSVILTVYVAVQRSVVCAFLFNGPKIFRVKTSVDYLLILTVCLFPQSFSVILLIENVQTVKVSFENETLSICVLIYGQTVENYREIHHFLALTKVLINQLATSAIVVFCMTYCLYTVKWKRMKLGKTTDQKNTFRTTAMLILIMLIFVLGNIPSTVQLCFDAFGFPQWVNEQVMTYSSNVILEMTFAANIWVYVIMSKQFRYDLKTLLCCKQAAKAVSWKAGKGTTSTSISVL
jgi:hypothetical protein